MSLIVNGVTLPSNAVITCNGVTLSSIVCNAVEVWKKGTLTLIEVVFNASGTFTMPANVVNNQVIVGCTGGGGGGANSSHEYFGAGGGSGRTSGTYTLTAGQTVTVTVGAGGAGVYNNPGYTGGTSSFGAYLSCGGGGGGYNFDGTGNSGKSGLGVSGGGRGGYNRSSATASSCASILTPNSNAVDNTTKLYAQKTYAGIANSSNNYAGGSGCYGVGVICNTPNANSGAGGGAGEDGLVYANGGSGKVVIYYYAMV